MAIDRVIPVLVYEDILTAHDFLVKAFGFEPGGVTRDEKGQVVHGEVRCGGNPIWLHRAADDLKLASPRSSPLASSGLVIYVPDVDAHYLRARSFGASVEKEPQDMPYGQREYGAVDPEGHRWWFATAT